MKEKIAMEPRIRIKEISEQFHNSLFSAIEAFRMGNDRQGLEGFMNAMEDLETILGMDQNTGTGLMSKDDIMPIMEELSTRIKNQDITGMTDLLEFELYPKAKELASNNENENSQTG